MGPEKPKKINKRARFFFGLFLLAGIPFSYGIYNIFEPEYYPIKFLRGEVVQVSESLITGPYPTEDEVKRLKKLGVTELIGLLDSQMPFESPLIGKEADIAAKYGLGFRNIPLMYLPNLNSKANLAKVADLVSELRDNTGRVYVHCYLGRHRVGLVRDAYLRAVAGEIPPKPSTD
ncbi:MAG TPA: hypothetical protein VIU33_07940 [Nitrospiria bacterium]